MSEKTRYLYIMGRGNSGSTMLDIVLGNSEHLVSTGELVSGIVNSKGLCGCGLNFSKCSFWNSVKEKYENQSDYDWGHTGEMIRKQANIKSLWHTLVTGKTNRGIQELVKNHDNITNSITEIAQKNCVVDSSKEFTRALFLSRFTKNYKIIHLIKDPNDIVASKVFRLTTGTPYRFLRSNYKGPVFIFVLLNSISWTIGNSIGEIIKYFAGKNYMRLKFEDFIADPKNNLDMISKFINYDLNDVYQRIVDDQPFKINHNLGGNRIKKLGTIKLKKSDDLKRPSKWYYKAIVYFFCWPLMLKYNYL